VKTKLLAASLTLVSSVVGLELVSGPWQPIAATKVMRAIRKEVRLLIRSSQRKVIDTAQ
jgi:hypothetical protein